MQHRLGLNLACLAQAQGAGVGSEGGTNSKEMGLELEREHFRVLPGRV